MQRKVHFVGAGGIGMSGLAEILLNLGYAVSGSDLHASDITLRLTSLGMVFHEGHDAANIGDADILVVSTAVRQDNPELLAARRRGTPILHRSELLADLMRLKPNAIAVGGTHGKTTTTSMISAILDRADIGATTLVGGILHRTGANARWGTGDLIVAEADEHDGSFLRLSPTMTVVTSIDAEHLEYYGTLDKIKHAFTQFCNQVPFYGYSIVCWDDPNIKDILPHIDGLCITYGIAREDGIVPRELSLAATNIRLETAGGQDTGQRYLGNARTCFDVVSHDERLRVTGPLGSLRVHAIGTHNVRNALAACAVGLCLGMDFNQVAEGLALYDGVRRRLQVCGELGGVTVVEDYAHHPTEILSTLEAVRWAKPDRIICVFQPHLYSRTKFFGDEFALALTTVDRAIVTDIYPSREEPMPGVDSTLVVDAARKIQTEAGQTPTVELINDMNNVPATLAPSLRSGDLVLLLGAGSINRIGAPLVDAIRERQRC